MLYVLKRGVKKVLFELHILISPFDVKILIHLIIMCNIKGKFKANVYSYFSHLFYL